MGGDDPVQPTPAPVVQSTQAYKSAVQDQLDMAPAVMAATEKYGTQYTELQRKLNPELAGASKTLSDFLSTTDDQEYNALKPGLVEDVRSAQSARGIGDISPLGSIDESVQVARLKQSLKDRRLNIALTTSGRQPIGSYAGATGDTGSIMGYQSNVNSMNASIYGTQAGMWNQQQQSGNVLGTIAGMGLGSMMGGYGTALGAGLGGGGTK